MNCPKCGKFAKSLLIDNLRDSIKYYLCECKCGSRFAYASEWTHEVMMGEAVCNQWLIDKEPMERQLKNGVFHIIKGRDFPTKKDLEEAHKQYAKTGTCPACGFVNGGILMCHNMGGECWLMNNTRFKQYFDKLEDSNL